MRLSFSTHPIKVIGSCSSFCSFRFLPTVRSCFLKPGFVDYNRRSPLRGIMAAATLKVSSIGATVGSNDEGIARRLWIKFHKDVIRALYTPFVVCLASGNLKLETFHQYIAQDVHFLKAFAQAYELAEECADDDDAKIAISDLRKSVKEELKLHDSFIQEWGADVIKKSNLNPATMKYTDFLVATASGKIDGVKGPVKFATPFERTKLAGYTLGAMTPCMRLYAFIGKEMQMLPDLNGSDHPYRKWIDNYASESFQAAAQQTEDLLDKLSVPLTGEELDIIEKLYHQAMNLEIDFFNAQPLVQPVILPLSNKHNLAENRLLIFSDFDLTCTIVDSSAILAEIAIVTAPKTDQNQESQIVRMSSADLRNTWKNISKQYTEEYEYCVENILLTNKAEKFDYDGLHKALEELSKFEKTANSRVIESGVLKGVNAEDVKRAGERLVLQDGCLDFFQSVRNGKLDAEVHLLSYCWCGDLIRAAFSSGGLDMQNIHANELVYEESISTGQIVKNVESPIDKVGVFNDILKKCNEKNNLSVYLGDSVGDLLCLLQADIGIVIGSSSSLRRLGSHFGVSFVPLFAGLVQKQKECGDGGNLGWKGLSGVLYTVTSWAEIHAFVLGCFDQSQNSSTHL